MSKDKAAYRKTPEEIEELQEDKQVILMFDNKQQFEGYFKEVDGDNIILKSLTSDDMVGLPLHRLKGFLEIIENKPETAIN